MDAYEVEIGKMKPIDQLSNISTFYEPKISIFQLEISKVLRYFSRLTKFSQYY